MLQDALLIVLCDMALNKMNCILYLIQLKIIKEINRTKACKRASILKAYENSVTVTKISVTILSKFHTTGRKVRTVKQKYSHFCHDNVMSYILLFSCGFCSKNTNNLLYLLMCFL